MHYLGKQNLGGVGLLIAGAVISSGCGSPAAGSGFHNDDERIAVPHRPIVIANPIANSAVESPFVLTGDGTAFKGILNYEIRDAVSDEVVDSGTTFGGSMGTLSKYVVELHLDPGNYTVTVSQTDPPERVLADEPFSTSLSFTVSGERAQ